jgi:membrane protease YdiL (CAAX protease family)
MILPLSSKFILMNLPNLEELLFLKVLALPKASRTGLVSRTCFSIPFTVLPLPAFAFSDIFKKSKSGPSNPVAA